MKNIRKIVAAALVTFQVILTAAVGFIPASAEAGTQGNAYSYQVYKADAPITVDGAVTEGEAWDNLPWSENFSWRWCQNNWHLKSDYIASFKSMWYKNADGEAFLYFLFNINDEDGNTISVLTKPVWLRADRQPLQMQRCVVRAELLLQKGS